MKTWPEPFQALWDGLKPYEIRDDDRGYMVGDLLELREWDPAPDAHSAQRGFTLRQIEATVTYKTPGGVWGLPHGLCVLGLRFERKLEAA